MIVPPFAGVTLFAFEDRLEFIATYWYREFVGLGRCKVSEAQVGDDMRPLFDALMGDQEVWVVVQWRRFDDGREEAINIEYISPDATEAEARRAFDRHNSFLNMSKKELQDLSGCFEASYEDLAYLENRFTTFPAPGPASN